MMHCFLGMYRLSTFEHPEWDRGFVQETLNISSLLGEVEKNFRQVKEAAGLDLGSPDSVNYFSSMASKVRSTKMAWDPTAASTMASLSAAPGDEQGDFPMELLDDEWLRALGWSLE